MPWAVAAPAISSIVGAGLGFLGNKGAQSIQEETAAKALDWQKQVYGQQRSDWLNAWNNWYSNTAAGRGGIDKYFGGGSPGGGPPGGGGATIGSYLGRG